LVADMTPEEQRNLGYSVQSFLINAGAVVGSALPFILPMLGVNNVPEAGKVAPSVIWSFYIGGSLLLISVLVTVIKTKEYPPKEFEEYKNITQEDKERKEGFFTLLFNMPSTMKQLAVVQLFSWFPFFLLWVYATTAISQHYYGVSIDFNAETASDAERAIYNNAGDWVNLCFAIYSLAAALFSIVLPKLISLTNRKTVYVLSLLAGGLGLLSMYVFDDKNMLVISMIGIGIAWAGILAMPYMILSGAIPAKRIGIYMGLFNLTVVIPQILSGVFGGPILKRVFDGNGIYIMVLAGALMLVGSISVLFVNTKTQEQS